jgi:hypothetical protein
LVELPPLHVIESGEVLTLALDVYEEATHVGGVNPVVNEELDEDSPFLKPEYVWT